jgi:endonuclease YncB( thermonuclease family)
MLNWGRLAAVLAAVIVAAAGLYVRLRWYRSPRAYRAMIALAICYFGAGALTGACIMRRVEYRGSGGLSTNTSVLPKIPAPAPSVVLASTQLANPLKRFHGKVVDITDGDTVDVLTPANLTYAVRLAGIDAPEHDQPFGTESTQHLSNLISGKTVTLDCEDERSYGRLICKILLADGDDVCLEEVKAGMAWHYKQYEDEQTPGDRQTYAAAECGAMKAKIGLWSDPHPIQPQDFRHATNSPLLFDANGCRKSSEPTSGPVLGNSRSHVFEWPACPYYSSISLDNQVSFSSPQAAEAAGYRPAHNCP